MMLKKGFPSRNEVVICTVKDMTAHSAFVYLDEYKGVEAMLHISEVAHGRIKNIRNHIQKGKQIICMVLRVNVDKGFVDVSLKRVSSSDSRKKFAEYRLSRRVDSMLSFISKANSEFDAKKMEKAILEQYSSLGYFLRSVQRKGIELVDSLEVNDAWKDIFRNEIMKILEKKEIVLKKTFALKCHEPDGSDKIKELFVYLDGKYPDIDAHYGGSPTYFLSMRTKDYKSAEKEFNSVMQDAESFCKKGKIMLEVVSK